LLYLASQQLLPTPTQLSDQALSASPASQLSTYLAYFLAGTPNFDQASSASCFPSLPPVAVRPDPDPLSAREAVELAERY